MTQTARRNPLVRPADAPDAVTLASDEPAVSPPLLYDYSRLDEEHRTPLMLAARRIKLKGQRIKSDLLDIGRELSAAKERLPHGQFGDWLSVEFEMSDRSARRFMRIYAEFGDNPEAVSILSERSLYLLADPATPAAARTVAVDEAHQTGRSPTTTRTKAIIAAHRPPPELPAPPPSPPSPTAPPPKAQTAHPLPIDEDNQDIAADCERQKVEAVEVTALSTQESEHPISQLYEVHAIQSPNHPVTQSCEAPAPHSPLHPFTPSPARAARNDHVTGLLAALNSYLNSLDLAAYSNLTGDFTSPTRLRNVTDVMRHKLEENLL